MNANNEQGRKEVLRVNGVVIAIVMALIGNLLIFVLGLWLHNIQLFRLEYRYTREQETIVRDIHKTKVDIVALEGVEKWEDTNFARSKAEENIAATGAR